ncbi:MAG: sugar phosphate isomerase/epimerase family protein [Candidatus Zipacnadales bacterium]
MRFGCQCRVEDMATLASVGYEFGETDASVLYPRLEEKAFRRARQALLAEPLFPEVVWVPGLLTGVGGEEVNLSLREVCRRAVLVGAKTLVIEAPKSPPHSRHSNDIWAQAIGALGSLGQQVGQHGLTVALRPVTGSLAKSLEEAWVLAEEVGHPAVGVAADLATVAERTDVAAAGSALKHVWVPLPRRYGGKADTTECLEALSNLAEFGYKGRVSIAAEWTIMAKVGGALLEDLRAYAEASAQDGADLWGLDNNRFS